MEAAMSAGLTVMPDQILKELAALWVEEGKHGASGVLRACSMTLVVMAEEGEDASALGETIASLMPEHPARAILVRLRAGTDRALSERVYQQCWKPFGQRQQICCEQIELTASDAALGDLPSVLLPLIVADLPVILWCRSPRLVTMPEFVEIARMATKVVLDSAAFPSAVEAFRHLTAAQSLGLHLGDLAWTRLTRWREMLARVFENRAYLARLNEINAVNVMSGPGFESAACYLGAWAQNALADAGVNARVSLAREAESTRVELAGSGLKVAMRREDDRLVVTVDELSNCTHLPPASDSLLMHEELGIVARDTVFERTLSSAARLAVSSASE
jgi:glucose-6-phosphate dehydrogenase assembly protein OpcA